MSCHVHQKQSIYSPPPKSYIAVSSKLSKTQSVQRLKYSKCRSLQILERNQNLTLGEIMCMYVHIDMYIYTYMYIYTIYIYIYIYIYYIYICIYNNLYIGRLLKKT